MSLFKYRKTRDNIEFSKNRILSSVRKEERAITLIALVITIIVLLILAGVTIATLTGENGILNQATSAQTKTIHSNILESLQLEQAKYIMDKNTGATTLNLIGYLQNKAIIGEEIEEGKWQINVKTLLGSKQKLGNGDYKTDGTDVYMLEKQSTTTGKLQNTKIASTTPIKIARTTDNKEQYKVVYYGNSISDNLTLGNIVDTNSVESNDLAKLINYFVNKGFDEIEWDMNKGDLLELDDGTVVTYIDYSEKNEYDYIQYNDKIYALICGETSYVGVQETSVDLSTVGEKELDDGIKILVTADNRLHLNYGYSEYSVWYNGEKICPYYKTWDYDSTRIYTSDGRYVCLDYELDPM